MKTLRTWVCSARLIGPALAAMLLTGTLAPTDVMAHQGHEHGNVIANADGDNVRLRSGPSYKDGEITRFPEGTGVDILDGPYDAADGSIWYQVDIDGRVGYMDSDYLVAIEVDDDEGGGDVAEIPSGPTSGTATTNDSVYLRSGPSTADSVVRTLAAGELVTLTGGGRDGWTSVSATDGDGWVYSEFLAFDNAPSGTRYTIDTVHLRSGPGTSHDSIAYLETGVQLEPTGVQESGFVQVTSPFGEGWVSAEYVGTPAPEASEPTPEPEQAGATGTRYTIDTVHLRSGAGTNFDSIAYLQAGVELQLTGTEESGFVEVTSSLGNGWVFAQYIDGAAPEAPTVPDLPREPEAPAEPDVPEDAAVQFTTANVNLRSGSSQAATVVTVVPTRTEVAFSGVTTEGFSEVRTTAGAGWIASEFLSDIRPEAPAGPAAEPQPEPEPSNSLTTWPVSGDEWVISQGYNGSSHQNQTQYWQYYYSFDLKRSDGSTAGQPVYSAVNGTVRWIDEATGGMSISMGDGLAYAYFHTRIDPGIQEGDTITQGQYMGTIAPAGEAASGSSAHLHITIWETSDEGNWSRRAVPFSGNVAIEGVEFPATGAGNDYRGYTFNP